MPTSVPNFSCISFKDTVGAPKYKSGDADFFKRPLADMLYSALVLVNAYEFAKFSLPNSITFGNTEEVP